MAPSTSALPVPYGPEHEYDEPLNAPADVPEPTGEAKELHGAPVSDHSGCMIALYPPVAVAQALALPGGLPIDELHVTIAYGGKAVDVDREVLLEIAEAVAGPGRPVRAVVSGFARFSAPDEDVLVALIDGPDVEDLRVRVRAQFAAAGLVLPRDHGFCAHMSIAYLSHDDPLPVHRLAPIDVEFSSLAVVHADDAVVVPFGEMLDTEPGLEDEPADDEFKAAGPPIDTGAWVTLGKLAGKVDMVVTSGTVPGAKSTSGEDVEGSKDSPAARVVLYERAEGGTWKSTGKRIASSVARLARTAPLTTRATKTAEAGIAAALADHGEAFPDAPVPSVAALTTAYVRGTAAWPTEAKTVLTAHEWAIGRVTALLAACAGLRPDGYVNDGDLLPAGVEPARPRPGIT